jgi:hypothetical protein
MLLYTGSLICLSTIGTLAPAFMPPDNKYTQPILTRKQTKPAYNLPDHRGPSCSVSCKPRAAPQRIGVTAKACEPIKDCEFEPKSLRTETEPERHNVDAARKISKFSWLVLFGCRSGLPAATAKRAQPKHHENTYKSPKVRPRFRQVSGVGRENLSKLFSCKCLERRPCGGKQALPSPNVAHTTMIVAEW